MKLRTVFGWEWKANIELPPCAYSTNWEFTVSTMRSPYLVTSSYQNSLQPPLYYTPCTKAVYVHTETWGVDQQISLHASQLPLSPSLFNSGRVFSWSHLLCLVYQSLIFSNPYHSWSGYQSFGLETLHFYLLLLMFTAQIHW